MRRARILLMFGIWVAVLPYLGFPYIWKNILFTVSGLALCYLSYLIYKEAKAKALQNGNSKKSFDNFAENDNFNESKIKEETQTLNEKDKS